MRTQAATTRMSRTFVWTGLVLYAVCIIYPFVWMTMSGFKTTSELFNNTWALPSRWIFRNYADAWNQGVGRYFLNSVIVTVWRRASCFWNWTEPGDWIWPSTMRRPLPLTPLSSRM